MRHASHWVLLLAAVAVWIVVWWLGSVAIAAWLGR